MFLWNNEQQPTPKHLNLPFSVCNTVSNLATCEMHVETDADLQECTKVLVSDMAHKLTLGLMAGEMILKPYFLGDMLKLTAVFPPDFKVLQWDDAGKIPLVTEFYERWDSYVRVERHTILQNEYVIANFALHKGKLLNTLPDWWKIYSDEVRLAHVKKPLFGYFKTVDKQPFYQKALPLMEQAEKQFSRLLWEFESGERALYVADTAFLRDKKGNPKLPDKKLYRLLATGKDDLFCDYSPVFRQNDIITGLNCIMQRIEDSLCLARGTLSEVTQSARTATELKISRHKTFTTVKSLQKSLRQAVTDMTEAACVLLCLYGRRKSTACTVGISFDDSVLLGRSDSVQDLLALLQNGVLSAQEVKEKWREGF